MVNFSTTKLEVLISFHGTIFLREFVSLFLTVVGKTPTIPNEQTNKLVEDNGAKTIWLKLPYTGKTGEGLVNKCVKKLNRLLGRKVKVIIDYDTTNRDN